MRIDRSATHPACGRKVHPEERWGPSKIPATSTVESHLAKAVEGGEKLDPRAFYNADEEAEMRIAFEGHEGLALKLVFEKLGEWISYGSLRLFLAFEQAAKSGTAT